MLRLPIGGQWIGDGEPCFIVAVAAEAKADAVKFQTPPETLIPKEALEWR